MSAAITSARSIAKAKSASVPISIRHVVLLAILVVCVLLALETWALRLSAATVGQMNAGTDEGAGTPSHAHQSAALPPPSVGIPACDRSPWKEDEDLVGTCPGVLTKQSEFDFAAAGRMALTDETSCAAACCESDDCITWQYRSDVGCLHGPDVRLGMEKDGVSAWCSDRPPYRWQGQYILLRKGGKIVDDRRSTACRVETWDPNEQERQCFGLGDVRMNASGSARECMEACCGDETCGAWQWQESSGCFYNRNMHGCNGSKNPIDFEPFVGRRKRLPSRQYIDKGGKPWKQTLPR